MALLGKRLAVAVPDTLLEEKDSLRDKTVKMGSMARAFAIHGVDVVEIFRDPGGRGEGALIMKVLEYLESPQYLRKRLYPIDEDLRFAGILPPLRIPSHRVVSSLDALKVGEVREGVANSDGTVDLGLPELGRLVGKVKPNARLTVRVRSKDPLQVFPIPRGEAGDYWGYAVESRKLEEVFDDQVWLKVATSRLGRPLSAELPRLRGAVYEAKGVKLIFGSPSRGLFEMGGQALVNKADFMINLFAEQHVETVRTEEAVFAGLSLVNLLLAEKGLSAN